MVINMMENGQMDDNMVKACIQIRMERQDKEFGKMEKESDGSMIIL